MLLSRSVLSSYLKYFSIESSVYVCFITYKAFVLSLRLFWSFLLHFFFCHAAKVSANAVNHK